MTQQTNGNGSSSPAPAFSEAPASINLRFDYRGFSGIQLTLRDGSGLALLEKLDAVLNKLEAIGATPGRSGSAPAAPAPSGEAGAVPVCPYHGPMKASSKKPGSYYCPAKMGDGSYCKEKHG